MPYTIVEPDADQGATPQSKSKYTIVDPDEYGPPAPKPGDPGFVDSIIKSMMAAPVIGPALGRVAQGGNLLGLPGPSALQQHAKIERSRPEYRPGMTMGQMMGGREGIARGLQDPTTFALGTGNIGQRAPMPTPAPNQPPAAPIRSRMFEMEPDQAALAQRGVQMTPGRVFGGLARGGEDVATSFPILGHFITNAKTRSIGSFNEATINQAMEPIGGVLPKSVKAGNDAVKFAGNKISDAYDDVLARIPSVAFDADLKIGLDAVTAKARQNPDVWRKFRPVLKGEVSDPFANSGRLEGADVKRIEAELNRQARGYLRSEEFDKQELGWRLLDLRGELLDAIERQYPAEAPDLVNANRAFAMQARIEQAAGRRKTSEGLFTPNDLLQASASQAQGVRRGGVARQFAYGDSLFQKWAQTAQRVLPSTVPDSGTPSRLLAKDALAGLAGVGGMMTDPTHTMMALGGLAGAGIPYMPPVSRGIQSLATPRGPAGQMGARGAGELDYNREPYTSPAGP